MTGGSPMLSECGSMNRTFIRKIVIQFHLRVEVQITSVILLQLLPQTGALFLAGSNWVGLSMTRKHPQLSPLIRPALGLGCRTTRDRRSLGRLGTGGLLPTFLLSGVYQSIPRSLSFGSSDAAAITSTRLTTAAVEPFLLC